MRNYKSISLLAGCLLTLAFPVLAHNIKQIPDGENYLLTVGHGDRLSGYKAVKVKNVTGYDNSGKQFPLTVVKREMPFEKLKGAKYEDDAVGIVPKNAGMITLLFDSGYWLNTTDDEWFNVSKAYFKDYKEVGQYRTYSKNLVRWSTAYSKPVGLEWEIVPLADPLEKNAQKLPIQLLLNGKPMADVEVEIEGNSEIFKTDANGKATIPLNKSGENFIGSVYTKKLENDKNADSLELNATLIFIRK